MDFFHLVFILVLEKTKKKAISQTVHRVLSHFCHNTATAKDGIPFLRIKKSSQFLKSDFKVLHFLSYFLNKMSEISA